MFPAARTRSLIRATACTTLIGCAILPAQEPAAAPPAPLQPGVPRIWTFDDGSAGWGPWGTTSQSRAELARAVAASTTEPHQGAGCLLVSDNLATANLYAVTNPAIPAHPGQTYLLSAWIRTATAAQTRPAVAVAAESTDPAKSLHRWIARIEVAPSTTWTQVTLAIPALPADTGALRLALFPVGAAEASATADVFLDDVRLELTSH